MLTYKDCLELSGLLQEEVDAIAEHEHIPEIVALEEGHYLVECEDGVPCLRRMILDDIRTAEEKGDLAHAKKLKLVLWHFMETHPLNPKNRPQ